MLSAIFKKKISNDILANYFVNGILNTIEKGFEEVKMLIAEDPSFLTPPPLENARNGHFAMIVITGNIEDLSNSFTPDQISELLPYIYKGFSKALGLEEQEFTSLHKDYKALMKRVNYPSKVVLYSMSRAIFNKYKLNEYQEDYFASLNTPNPLFIKRLDEVMRNFLWNWDVFFKRYKFN